MSHLVVLPACSLLGAQLELFPRIFFSTWQVYTLTYLFSQGLQPRGYSQKKMRRCAARFPKALPYLLPKSTIFLPYLHI